MKTVRSRVNENKPQRMQRESQRHTRWRSPPSASFSNFWASVSSEMVLANSRRRTQAPPSMATVHHHDSMNSDARFTRPATAMPKALVPSTLHTAMGRSPWQAFFQASHAWIRKATSVAKSEADSVVIANKPTISAVFRLRLPFSRWISTSTTETVKTKMAPMQTPTIIAIMYSGRGSLHTTTAALLHMGRKSFFMDSASCPSGMICSHLLVSVHLPCFDDP
mmetsp:Transcript_15040/g.38243  ORF Transcript_15040/g.38243 Transcript_15040/m.38243 type:complete len:222 (+) Transcript_15040:823-1488(+)